MGCGLNHTINSRMQGTATWRIEIKDGLEVVATLEHFVSLKLVDVEKSFP
jgi:hypothetical protein